MKIKEVFLKDESHFVRKQNQELWYTEQYEEAVLAWKLWKTTLQSSFSTNEQHRNGHSRKINLLKINMTFLCVCILERDEDGVSKVFLRLNDVLSYILKRLVVSDSE